MKKYWLTSGVFSLMSNFAMLGFGFVTFLLLVRIMPQDEFGIWVLYLTVTSIAQIMRNGLIQNALVKHLHGGKTENYSEIVTASFVLHTLTGLVTFLMVAALAGVLAKLWSTPILKPMLYIYGLTMLLETPLQFFQFLFMANLNFVRRFWSIISYNAVLFFIILYLYIFKGEIQLIALPYYVAFSCLPALIISYFMVKPFLRFKWPIEKKWMSELFHYGKYVIGTSLSSILFNRVDIMMLGYFLNTQLVAIYNVPSRISNYAEVPLGSVAAIVFPQAAMRIKEQGEDAARYLWERSVGVLLAIVIPTAGFIFIFAEWIVIIVAGPEYREATTLMRLFAVLTVMKPFGRQSGTIMDSLGKPKINFQLLILSLAFNIILNWIFIQQFGIMGAIFATMISIAVTTFISIMVLKKMINVKLHHPFIYMMTTYRDVFNKIKNKITKKDAANEEGS